MSQNLKYDDLSNVKIWSSLKYVLTAKRNSQASVFLVAVLYLYSVTGTDITA